MATELVYRIRVESDEEYVKENLQYDIEDCLYDLDIQATVELLEEEEV